MSSCYACMIMHVHLGASSLISKCVCMVTWASEQGVPAAEGRPVAISKLDCRKDRETPGPVLCPVAGRIENVGQWGRALVNLRFLQCRLALWQRQFS